MRCGSEMMALLIRNGEIVTVARASRRISNVENETITRIGKDVEAPSEREIIDAPENLFFRVSSIPTCTSIFFHGDFAKDTHETASNRGPHRWNAPNIEMCCPIATMTRGRLSTLEIEGRREERV